MMSNWVRLVAPNGCDEANFGEMKFRVRDDSTITVPPEAVDGLTREGGFVIAPDDYQPAAEVRPTTLADVLDVIRRLPDQPAKWPLLAILEPPHADAGPRITLKAGSGVGGASHAGEHFEPDELGFINVPADAVPHLVGKGGYALAQTPISEALPDGLVAEEDAAPVPDDPPDAEPVTSAARLTLTIPTLPF